MEELSGPVVGIAPVLSAVFVPTAFIPGITGRLYQQFAVTIAISVLLSAFNALTLSPALASLLLRPKDNLQKFLVAARKRPEIGLISSTFIPSAPQEFVQVDRDKVLKQGVAISDVYQAIQAFMGGLFINYYNNFGRTWQVFVEAEAPYRSDLTNVGQFYVRNNRGEMAAAHRAHEI